MGQALHELSFTLCADLSEIGHDWQRLSADPRNSLHQSPQWCMAWAKAHGIELHVLRGTIDGKTMLLLPLELKTAVYGRVLSPPGAGFNNINLALVDADLTPPSTQDEIDLAAQKIGKAIGTLADALIIPRHAFDWRGRKSCFAGQKSVQSQNLAFQLPLLQSFDQTLAQVNAKRRRKKFRISQRHAEELGGYRHRIAKTTLEKQTILQAFFEQKAKRFASHGLPDVFADSAVKRFFEALLPDNPSPNSDAMLELHYIELQGAHHGQIASITGLSRKGDHCICQFGTINEDLDPAFSPGELLFYHVIDHECFIGSAMFDFGVGDQPYKRSWCPVSTDHHTVYIPASRRGKLLVLAHGAATRASGAIKHYPLIYKTLQKLRRLKA